MTIILDSVDLAAERVKSGVLEVGHNITYAAIYRRYLSGLRKIPQRFISSSEWLDICGENSNTKTCYMLKVIIPFVFSLVLFSCEKDKISGDITVDSKLFTTLYSNSRLIL